MRVCLDSRYVRERPSGIGAYVGALIERLPRLAPDSTFELWVHPRAPRPLSSEPTVTETVVRAPANGLGTLLRPSRLGDLKDIDVLHAPFNLLGRGLRLPTVVTIHDLMWLDRPTLCEAVSPLLPAKVLFYRDGILRALTRATRIVTISSASADAILARAPRAAPRLRVIPHGVDARFRPPAERAAVERRLDERLGIVDPYFLVVGQNTPSKNHAAVLHAFARARLPKNYRLVLLQRLYKSRWGRGLEAEARRLGIRHRLLSLPAVTDSELLELLQGATALVQFSRFEGFGLPVLEAAACGTPVVASDIAPLREVMGGAALHVPLRAEALSRALERIAHDATLWRELSHAGLERSREFSWHRSATAHLEVYRDAARAGRGW